MGKTNVKWLLLLCLASVLMWAQVVGNLSGKVTNAAGTGVPNAAVTITNVDTNASAHVLTGSDGSFTIAGLPPGSYRIDVETAGFKRTSVQNVKLTAGAPVTVHITLQAGNIQETVEIKGTAPNTQAQDGVQSLGIYDRTVRELPIIDRNWQELMDLQTGITPPFPGFPFFVDPDHNRFFSTNGQNPAANSWHIEGLDNDEPFRGVAIRVQPVESVKQVSVVSGTWNAGDIYAGGAYVTTIARPGTNPWHGSLFEFNSFNGLRTRNTFNQPGNPTPRFTYNQFGGTAGGRIITDKTFLFLSYEGTYNHGQNTVLTTVPTPAMVTGNFSALPGVTIFNPATGLPNGVGRTPFTGNVVPTGFINRTSAAIAAALPAPNLPGFTNNFVANRPYQNDWQKADVRLDQHFGDRTLLMLRYGYSNLHSVNFAPFDNILTGAASLLGASAGDRTIGQNAVINFTHSFSPTLLTDFRAGYNRYTNRLNSNPGSLGLLLGFPNSLPNISISGMLPFGPLNASPVHGIDNNFDFVWNWTWLVGHHKILVGTDLRRFRSDGFFDPLLFGTNGTALFQPGVTASPITGTLTALGSFANSFASFLLGAPTTTGAVSFVTTPTIRQSLYGVYIRDAFQLGRNLSLDLGVRYEVFDPLAPRNPGGAMYYDPFTNTLNFAGIGGVNQRANVTDVDNVSPHVSFAYSPWGKTVIRGGYSINYYQPTYLSTPYIMPVETSVSAGVPNTFTPATGGFSPGAFIPPTQTTPLVSGIPAPNIPLVAVSRDLQTPYVQSFHFQVQQELIESMVLSVGYVGALARDLPSLRELNAALPGTGILGLPFLRFGRTASTLFYSGGLTSNYNALQARLSKRFAQGIMFEGAFTYGKVLGFSSGGSVLVNPFNTRANYGPLDWDRKYLLTISHLWELPVGAGTHHLNHGIVGHVLGNWQINGVFTWATGTPLTITETSLFCNCPNLSITPDVTTSNVTNSHFGPNQPFLNTSAFVIPSPGSFGNLGRGAIRGPDSSNYNLSLFRSFPFRDQYKLEFRGEAYNLLNSPHFLNPVTNFDSNVFGQVLDTINAPFGSFGRQVNVAVRILF